MEHAVCAMYALGIIYVMAFPRRPADLVRMHRFFDPYVSCIKVTETRRHNQPVDLRSLEIPIQTSFFCSVTHTTALLSYHSDQSLARNAFGML